MKKLVIYTAVLAAGLTFGGAAIAAPWSWTGTLQAWASSGGIVDGDGDATFTLAGSGIGGTLSDTTSVTISEQEVGDTDFYNVGLDWGTTGYAGGGSLTYTIAVTGEELIASAALDTVELGSGTSVVKTLSDLPSGAVFASLSSINGARDPVSGMSSFAPRTTLTVTDVIGVSSTGVLNHMDNSFVAVPEPSQASMVGLALFGLMMARRRRRT